MTKQTSFPDVEIISAYLDGHLSDAEKARLVARLKTDPELRTILDDLSSSRALLRKLPARRAPRNFTLTPKMAGVKPPLPRAFSFFRLASGLAAILFFFSFAANLSVPAMASIRAYAPAPVMGMGGGGGGSDNPPSIQAAAPAAPAESTANDASATPSMGMMAMAPTPTPEAPPTEPASQAKIMPTPEPQQPAFDTSAPLKLPIPAWLQFSLLGLAVVSGGAAYFMRARSEDNWFKARALKPGESRIRRVILLILALLLVLALAASIYYVSKATFFAAAPRTNTFPGALGGDKGGPLAGGDKGPTAVIDKGGPPPAGVIGPTVSGGDKGSGAPIGAQGFTLTAGMGYNFTTADPTGLITAIDFPVDVFPVEMLVSYIPGLSTTPPDVTFFGQNSFSLVPADKNMQPQKAFTISMDYNKDIAAAVKVDQLMIYWWNGTTWQDAASTCSPASGYDRSPDANRISLAVCQMGSFVLVAP